MKHRAFSLIEIMVVLAVVAIVSSMTFGVYKNISNGNKITTCQSNLSQIYSAARQYARDYDGKFPYFHPAGIVPAPPTSPPSSVPVGGIGLWSLYAYGDTLTTLRQVGGTGNLPPSYLRSSKVLHCPSDDYKRTGGVDDPAGRNTTQPTFISGGVMRPNPEYLSYQVKDDTPISPENWTYSSFRERGNRHQLYFFDTAGLTSRQSPDNTVFLWCRFHRPLSASEATIDPAGDSDNVLFLDGSVQKLDVQQFVGAGTCQGWRRVPRNEESTSTSCS